MNKCELAKEASNADLKTQLYAAICRDELNLKDEAERRKLSLMRDVFGNFVVQMILETGRADLRQMLIEGIPKQVTSLSFDKFGCRIV